MNDILLLVQKCAHTFSFYDLETRTALKHIVLPSFPHEFTVDVAESATQVNLGLRYRHSIDPDGGLLIVQSIAAPVIMQVSNQGMSLPMDLLFLASDGTVREVHPWVPPDSSDPIVSTAPVAAALELKGGTVTRYGVLPGDRVIGGGLGAASP